MKVHKTFQIFSNTPIVKGYTRSCFYDLQKNRFVLCPNLFYELFKDGSISESNFHAATKDSKEEAIEFLLSNSLVFSNNIPENFPMMSLDWDSYSFISNLILHSSQLENFKEINTYLDELLIQATEILSLNDVDQINFLRKLDGNFLRAINISIDKDISNNLFQTIAYSNSKITAIKLKFADSNIFIKNLKLESRTNLDIIVKDNDKEVNNQFVEPNIELFTESQHYHTYFNRKLYIGRDGEIKNAPECDDSFGFIQGLDSPNQLRDIIQSSKFQKYWFVHKDILDVCKDCEFRHMCVDNRLPHKREEKEWYHKIECNYNPYIAKWQGEEGYKNLAECGVISDESGFKIDHDKITKINAELWPDE